MSENKKERPIYFYVANLGSEVQRIFSWKEKGDKEAVKGAFKRTSSIIETIKKFNNTNANAEMDILQNFLNDFMSEKISSSLARSQLSSYFNPFAMRVISSL